MLPPEHPDRIRVASDDHLLVANAGLLVPIILARCAVASWFCCVTGRWADFLNRTGLRV